MLIGIDARKIGDSGIGRYIENLVENLLQVDDRHNYVLFMAPGEERNFDSSRVRMVFERAGKYSLTEHFSLARSAEREGVDLFHAPHYTLPLTMKIPAVVTIHDLIHLQEPTTGLLARSYARFMIGQAARKARAIITVSETSKAALVELMRILPDKIVVTPNGGGDFGPMESAQVADILTPLGVTPGYILYVGSDRPHKNIFAMAEVMKRLPSKRRGVVVGRVRNRSRFTLLNDRLTFLDSVNKTTLQALYCGAAALLFPSYLEGFGLPPLEAMACGTAVVASNRSSIPEVCGDAALLYDPDDHNGMAAALQKIDADHDFRATLVAHGFERLTKFSWEKTARETVAVYQKVLTQ